MNSKTQIHADIAAAKAKVIETAAKIDPLGPLRKHPYWTIFFAGATGAVMGSETDHLAGAATLVKSLTSAVRAVSGLVSGVEKFKQGVAAGNG
ncbi:MAG: hypothetical protein ABSH22_19595, partial [Tepidisphaeraceae bacterium]